MWFFICVKFVNTLILCVYLSSWESAKTLMSDSSFFQELIFYKKDSIPENMFEALGLFVESPFFIPDVVKVS